MALVTNVKVGNITNLSDARYCAGMGVQRLGINVITGSDTYVSAAQWSDITSWISGPRTVVEVYRIKTSEDFHEIERLYKPDYFEMGLHEYTLLKKDLATSVMLKITSELQKFTIPELNKDKNIESLIVSEDDLNAIVGLNQAKNLFIIPNGSKNIVGLLTTFPNASFSLTGSSEEKPGLKNYDELSAVLEQLEEV